MERGFEEASKRTTGGDICHEAVIQKTHRGNMPGAAAEIQVDGEAGGLIDIFATAAAETLVGYR